MNEKITIRGILTVGGEDQIQLTAHGTGEIWTIRDRTLFDAMLDNVSVRVGGKFFYIEEAEIVGMTNGPNEIGTVLKAVITSDDGQHVVRDYPG